MSSRGVRLYRSILKEHRNRLPPNMRTMGNSYVKNEFKLHKNAKPEQLVRFFEGWTKYLEDLQGRSSGFGKKLSDEEQAVLSPEQQAKLEELKREIDRDAKSLLEK
jgi:hypothetical protein